MITPDQAVKLFQVISTGPAIGADPDGNPVYADTNLGMLVTFLGLKPYLYRKSSPKPGMSVWDTREAVGMLREWADALEEAGK